MAKKNKRYQRSFIIDLDPRNLYEFEKLAFDFNTQKIVGVKNGEFHSLIGTTKLQFERDRENGRKKTLHESLSSSGDAWFSANHQLLAYDHLIAVDTNTNYLNGASVSITAAYHMIPRVSNPEHVFCHARVLALIEMWNVPDEQEKLGWWQILQAIEKHPIEYSDTIGLIVDSDLGSHKEFNSRAKPIIFDYYLPDNVKLIYASDKGGQEFLSTKMIKYCHDLAADLYKNENLIMNTDGLHKGVKGLYSHIRQWDTESRALRPFALPIS